MPAPEHAVRPLALCPAAPDYYLEHIDIYHDRIRMFHVKDAELNPTGRQGVYGGYQSWVNRAGRFRSPRRWAGGFRAASFPG
jgi:sugar phosphate isomerase/epimerase